MLSGIYGMSDQINIPHVVWATTEYILYSYVVTGSSSCSLEESSSARPSVKGLQAFWQIFWVHDMNPMFMFMFMLMILLKS